MRKTLHRVGVAVAALACAAVLLRATWVASHTEGGWEILGDHLRAGLPRALRGSGQAFDERGLRKSEWLWEQANRVEADPKAIAADFMGAALSFVQFFNRPGVDIYAFGGILWRDNPTPGGAESTATPQPVVLYEDWMRRSRNLAAHATQLEPDQVEWWRLRAVLMNFRHGVREGPRLDRLKEDPEFDLELLDEGVKHDPENALYDYLAGSYLWSQSVARGFRSVSGFDVDIEREATILQRGHEALLKQFASTVGDHVIPPVSNFDRLRSPVVDREQYSIAMEHFRRALARSCFATGAASSTAVVSFLDHCPSPISVKLQYLEPMKFSALRSSAYPNATGPIHEAVAAHLRDRDLAGTIHLLERVALRFLRQAEAAGEPIGQFRANFLNDPWSVSPLAAARTTRLSNSNWLNQGPLDDPLLAQYDAFNRLLKPTQQEQLVLSAGTAWSAAQQAEEQKWEAEKIWSYLGVACAAIGWLLLVLGAASYVCAWLIGLHMPRVDTNAAIWRSTTIWIAVLGIVFSLYGLIPAFEPEMANYHWSVSAATATAFALIFGYFGWMIGRFIIQQGRLLPHKRTVNYHLARLALVIGVSPIFLVPLLALSNEQFRTAIVDIGRHFPNDLGIVKRNAWGSFAFSSASLIGALLQFAIHGGLFITAGVGIALLAVRNWRRITRQQAGGTSVIAQARARLATSLRNTGKATMLFAIFMLIASVATTSQWIVCLRSQYELQHARRRSRLVRKGGARRVGTIERPLTCAATDHSCSSPCRWRTISPSTM